MMKRIKRTRRFAKFHAPMSPLCLRAAVRRPGKNSARGETYCLEGFPQYSPGGAFICGSSSGGRWDKEDRGCGQRARWKSFRSRRTSVRLAGILSCRASLGAMYRIPHILYAFSRFSSTLLDGFPQRESFCPGLRPRCGVEMKKRLAPLSPCSAWKIEFMYICFNDECPYLLGGWDAMRRQGNRGVSYRLMYDLSRDVCMPVPVPSLDALKESIVE